MILNIIIYCDSTVRWHLISDFQVSMVVIQAYLILAFFFFSVQMRWCLAYAQISDSFYLFETYKGNLKSGITSLISTLPYFSVSKTYFSFLVINLIISKYLTHWPIVCLWLIKTVSGVEDWHMARFDRRLKLSVVNFNSYCAECQKLRNHDNNNIAFFCEL